MAPALTAWWEGTEDGWSLICPVASWIHAGGLGGYIPEIHVGSNPSGALQDVHPTQSFQPPGMQKIRLGRHLPDWAPRKGQGCSWLGLGANADPFRRVTALQASKHEIFDSKVLFVSSSPAESLVVPVNNLWLPRARYSSQ